MINDRIHLFEDERFVLEGSWVFGSIVNNDYHLLQIDSNGKLDYFCHDFSELFPLHPYSAAIDLVIEANKPYQFNKKSAIEAFIISPNQDVNIIVSEDESVLPDLSRIEAELKQNEASLPEQYRVGANIAALLEDLAQPEGKQWKSFIQDLIEQAQPLDKNGLKKLIKKHYHTSRNEYKSIRKALLEQGIVLSFSKTNDSLFDKMGDLFSIRAGEIGDGAGVSQTLCNCL